MFHVRKMTAEDFEFAVSLTDTMNWGSVEEDFEFMRRLEPDGCLVLLHNSERAGIATAVSYDRVGWLGNVIVRENYRGKGGGSLLVKRAIEYLTANGVETVGLYGYLDKTSFYAKHDFRFDSMFVVLKGRGFHALTKARIRKAAETDMQQIIGLDQLYFGGSRRKLLSPILRDSSNACYVCTDNGGILGFAVAKEFEDVSEIGPLVCREGYGNATVDLLKTVLAKLEGCKVSLCLPERESAILALLKRHEFKESFRLARMFRGKPVVCSHVYVTESLERG